MKNKYKLLNISLIITGILISSILLLPVIITCDNMMNNTIDFILKLLLFIPIIILYIVIFKK